VLDDENLVDETRALAQNAGDKQQNQNEHSRHKVTGGVGGVLYPALANTARERGTLFLEA
jgi:hypothetical protein